MSPPNRIVEDPAVSNRRARQLYKFFTPPDPHDPSPPQPDTVLTAHAQLVAWRLQSQRAMVSLIDRETQYFVAESTRTLNINDSTDYEDPNDAIWAGCVSVEKAGRLCEHTIQTIPSIDGHPACFEVCDLSADDRFKTLPFVSGPPYFKYYCGVPLRSDGINIGSLFALDGKVREPSSLADKLMLSRMGDLVIAHLETMREKEDLKRATNMNLALAAFVDPENRTRKPRPFRLPDAETKNPASAEMDWVEKSGSEKKLTVEKSMTLVERAGQRLGGSKDSPRSISAVGTSDIDSDDGTSSGTEDGDENLSTFKRAASLLRDSLALRPGSGVVFLDAGNNLHSSRVKAPSSEDYSISSDEGSSPGHTVPVTERAVVREPGSKVQPAASLLRKKMSSILAFSSPGEASFGYDTSALPVDPATPGFISIAQSAITKLIKRHPRGKLFSLDGEDASGSSSDDHNGSRPYNMPRTHYLPSKGETTLLKTHFPNSRQIIFVPCWDPSSSRHIAFFAYNANEYRRFTKNPDFLHCLAFCNCISTEISRLATLASDQQKSDFIGSVSHELRSPLHGILGSCEFLDDTELSPFQRSLVDTADGCARTLLDTISMVLDYSKINAFERSVVKAKRSRHAPRGSKSNSHLQPTLNIYGSVDLSTITEEVLEGVARGFQHSLQDIDVLDVSQKTAEDFTQNAGINPEVEIYLDMEPRDWIFVTQPGAFRRIIMNLFGNALKYTTQGFIRVSLEAEPLSKNPDEAEENQLVTLRVTDTGQGISPNYMRTKLFTPFAQENAIAPGTGLGLSLVRSIVLMLHGEIDIQSTVGVGTEVTCKFVMTLSRSAATSGATVSSTGSIERQKDDSIVTLQQKSIHRTAMAFGTSESSSMVDRYLTQWYGFGKAEQIKDADLVVVRQSDFAEMLQTLPEAFKIAEDSPMIVVLCTSVQRGEFSSLNADVEAISYPFGPIKLAKAIRACFDRHPRYANSKTPLEVPQSSVPEDTAETNTDEAVQAVDSIDMNGMQVLQKGNVTALASSISTRSIEQLSGFPFPDSNEASASATPLDQTKPTTPGAAVQPAPVIPANAQNPRVLLVEDNKINLRLLQTFMRKRGYKDIFSAEDGAQAVAIFKDLMDQGSPPQIIFMDVSMPIMDGFESTRQIRKLEAKARIKATSLPSPSQLASSSSSSPLPPLPPSPLLPDARQPEEPPTCMIIALTGLASARDQNEAFTSGVDLYLTKPIPFKSVAKLLDNWEKTGAASTG